MNGYREYRKKVEIYAARMAVSGKEETVGLDILGSLRGKAWDATEDLAIDQVATAKGWQAILSRLDHVFKLDARTELPSQFENVFYKTGPQHRETLVDYISRFAQSYRRVREHFIELPKDCLLYTSDAADE